MATIADLFSYIDSQKRRLSDTVQNPVLSLMQALGNANDQARTFNQAQQAAASEWQKTKQLNGPATQNVDRMMAESLAPAGMTVYHGSPYRFTAFDPKKIGSGEGAQAYGHGLYVAENPEIADSYKKSLAYKAFDLQPEAEKLGIKLSAGARGEFLRQVQKDAEPAILARRLQNANISTRDIPQEKLAELFDAYKQKGGGNLYKIDLPDEHIDKMLDWDKPLSQQPAAVQKELDSYDPNWLGDKTKQTGADFYKRIVKMYGDDAAAASKSLADSDIVGIKYLDQQSRNAPTKYHVGSPAKGFGDYTQFDNKLDALNQLSVLKNFGLHDAELKEQVAPQTRNFVVFPGNEDILKIQDVNGNPIQQ